MLLYSRLDGNASARGGIRWGFEAMITLWWSQSCVAGNASDIVCNPLMEESWRCTTSRMMGPLPYGRNPNKRTNESKSGSHGGGRDDDNS